MTYDRRKGVLVHDETQKRIVEGDTVVDFRGEKWIVETLRPADGKIGYVDVSPVAGEGLRSFYPSVFECHFRNPDDLSDIALPAPKR